MSVFKGHIIAAACEELTIESPEVVGDHITANITSPETKHTFVRTLATKVVDKCTFISEPFLGQQINSGEDHIYNYARQLCHYASLIAEFTDAWSEGDGTRVIRCWKLFLPHFFATSRTKYALQALRLQLQLMTLQPQLVSQLTWGRFINTKGGPGRNIPCDLHNEHTNKVFKEVVGNMGSNFTQKSSTRVARCITSLHNIAEKFDNECSVPKESTGHTTKSDIRDVHKVCKVVMTNAILKEIPGRCHSSHQNISADPLVNLNRDKINKWMKEKFEQRQKYLILHDALLPEQEQDQESNESDDDDDIFLEQVFASQTHELI